MEFVKNFTQPDFQAKNFTPSISPSFNSFSKKKTQKMSENGEIYTAGKNFTLPLALTGWTNSTSGMFSKTVTLMETVEIDFHHTSVFPAVRFIISSSIAPHKIFFRQTGSKSPSPMDSQDLPHPNRFKIFFSNNWFTRSSSAKQFQSLLPQKWIHKILFNVH